MTNVFANVTQGILPKVFLSILPTFHLNSVSIFQVTYGTATIDIDELTTLTISAYGHRVAGRQESTIAFFVVKWRSANAFVLVFEICNVISRASITTSFLGPHVVGIDELNW